MIQDEAVLQGNKLIAEFMGWRPSVVENGINLYYLPNDTTGEYNHSCKQMSLESMIFHTSWDWIMFVVNKIESLTEDTLTCVYWFEITPSFINFYSHPQFCKTPDFEIKIKNNDKLTALYLAVVKFIEWYNTQNKQ